MGMVNKTVLAKLKKKALMEEQRRKAEEILEQRKLETTELTKELNEMIGEKLMQQLGTEDYEAALKFITNIKSTNISDSFHAIKQEEQNNG